ncbi:MAG: glycosyltransferase [Rhodospirillaceae bacterium]|nr:glycosyltransferase [Rhodospirillaceae bacterium]
MKLVPHVPSKNAVNAGNFAIKTARGDHITFLDSDDIYHEDRLKSQVVTTLLSLIR